MKAYIVPDWITIIAGLVIYRFEPQPQVLFGLRSKRAEAGKWGLPTGLGAIRRDISSRLAVNAPDSLENPESILQSMSKRHQQAFRSPGGFAFAEAQWYVKLFPDLPIEQLTPLKAIPQLDNDGLLVKIYFGLEWREDTTPKPADTDTEWPFKKVRFFSRERLKNLPVAFGCDKDLEEIWPQLQSLKQERG